MATKGAGDTIKVKAIIENVGNVPVDIHISSGFDSPQTYVGPFLGQDILLGIGESFSYETETVWIDEYWPSGTYDVLVEIYEGGSLLNSGSLVDGLTILILKAVNVTSISVE